jgi:urate oxidase
VTYELADNRYGKASIRLVTVSRRGPRHELRDLTVDVMLEGDFAAAHVSGDNAKVVATDTMKNTVYAMARDHLADPPERFGRAIAEHFAAYPQVDRAEVTLRQHDWARIATPSGDAADAFVRAGAGTRWASASASRAAPTSLRSGIEDVTVLKTWGYASTAGAGTTFDFDAAHATAVERLLTTFAEHHSPSVQASIWMMAGAMLDAVPEIDWVRMVLPNLHHWQVDLTPFGLENRGDVFVATTEPHGLIDATVRRGG